MGAEKHGHEQEPMREYPNREKAVRILENYIKELGRAAGSVEPLLPLASDNLFQDFAEETEAEKVQNNPFRIERFIAASRLEEIRQCIEALKQTDVMTALCILAELQGKIKEMRINGGVPSIAHDFNDIMRLIVTDTARLHVVPTKELQNQAEIALKNPTS